MNKSREIIGLICWLSLSGVVAWFGAQFNTGDWYEQLRKPTWTPPGWIFGPVWSILYILMAVSAWLIWKTDKKLLRKTSLQIYIVKMICNGMWSFLFFGLHEIGWALFDILLLLILIILITILFYRDNKAAGILLIPYAVWVGFATVLNFNIWLLN